jgi:hypothetical protein
MLSPMQTTREVELLPIRQPARPAPRPACDPPAGLSSLSHRDVPSCGGHWAVGIRFQNVLTKSEGRS